MKIITILLSNICAVLFFSGCATPKLVGTVSGDTYTSGRKDYSVPFPVSTALEGHVAGDDINGVTFKDNMAGNRISFYSYPLTSNSKMVSVINSKGKEAALAEYAKVFYRLSVPPNYHPEVRDGCISFAFVKQATGGPCGGAAFVHGDFLYTVECEPPLAALFFRKFDKKPKQELDVVLENRAIALLQTIHTQ